MQSPASSALPDSPTQPTARPRHELLESWLTGDAPTESTQESADGHTITRQHPDGSGVTYADGAVEAVRLADGRVFLNPPVADESTWPNLQSLTETDGIETDTLPGRFAGAVIRAQTETQVHPARFTDEVTSASAWGTGMLLEHESGIQVYVGYDETGTPGNRQFGFALDDHHLPRTPTARDAIHLLEPDAVASTQTPPPRQGEWFFVAADDVPAGTPQQPSINGPSPLANHIPERWATRVSDQVFREEVIARGDIPLGMDPATPEDALALAAQDDTALTLADIRAAAGGIAIQGSVHHRADDHDALSLPEGWHHAYTHDIDVMTEDDAGGLMVD